MWIERGPETWDQLLYAATVAFTMGAFFGAILMGGIR